MSEQQDAYDSYYSKRYLNWSFNVRGKARSFARLVKQAGVPDQGADILDVGFGAGAMLQYFQPSCHLSGVEFSRSAIDRMVRIANRRGYEHADLRLWDGQQPSLPYSAGSFDVVIMSHILEHLIDDEVVVGEARRVLRTGGHIVVMVPLDDVDSLSENRDHLRLYDPPRLQRLLESNGFEVISVVLDHRVENVLRMIERSSLLRSFPRLRSRLLGSVSLLLALVPFSERLPFVGPCRNVGMVARASGAF